MHFPHYTSILLTAHQTHVVTAIMSSAHYVMALINGNLHLHSPSMLQMKHPDLRNLTCALSGIPNAAAIKDTPIGVQDAMWGFQRIAPSTGVRVMQERSSYLQVRITITYPKPVSIVCKDEPAKRRREVDTTLM
jgi:hypothetical protein